MRALAVVFALGRDPTCTPRVEPAREVPAHTAGATASPVVNSASASALLAALSPPLPRGLALEPVAPARAWDTGENVWAVEFTVEIANRGDEPIEIEPAQLLRVRDQSHVLRASPLDESDRNRARISPGTRRVYRARASRIPTAAGRPELLRVDYGYAGAMSAEVTIPVTVVASTGLVLRATVRGPAVHRALAIRGRNPPQFAWQLALDATVQNPTNGLRRVPFGGLAATRDGGEMGFWSDGAGMHVSRDWLEPGESATAAIVLLFPDAYRGPTQVTVRYLDGPTQTLTVPRDPSATPAP